MMAKYKVSNEQSMGEALSLWLDRYRLRRGTDETRVLQAWDELMGPSIVRQTTKKKVQNQILYVQLESAVVRKELLMVKSKIISSINEHLSREAIKDVHLY
jgi:predicted nucleic acid-binding Zn ribbon protein